MKTDKELSEYFKIFADENDTVNLIFLKELKDPKDSDRFAELLVKAITKILDKNPRKKYNLLVNTLPIGRFRPFLSRRARKMYLELATKRRFGKSAVVGRGFFIKALGRFLALTGRVRAKWFASEEEARKWLERK